MSLAVKNVLVTKKFRLHLPADFLARHRPFPVTKLILKISKISKISVFGVNFVTFFSKMRFSSKFASKTFKMVFLRFFRPWRWFLYPFLEHIYDKLKFWLFQIFPRQNCPYNRNVTCAEIQLFCLRFDLKKNLFFFFRF